jgi:ribosomal protein L7/L12
LVLQCRRCGHKRFFEVQFIPPPAPAVRDSAALLPEAAIAALSQGKKVDAIKIVREATGLGLKEAKDAVERYVRGDRPDRGPERQPVDGDAFPLAAVTALHGGRMIEAVKVVRLAHPIGLKDAKDAVDRFVATQPALRDRLEAAQAETRRRALLWATALAVLAGLAAYALVN